MRLKYFLCHLFILENYPILHICKCQKYVNLLNQQIIRVKLESICAEVFSVSAMTIKCQYVTRFIQRTGIYQSLIMSLEVNHVTNKGDYQGKRVDVAHQARKGCKTTSKKFGLHKFADRQIVKSVK